MSNVLLALTGSTSVKLVKKLYDKLSEENKVQIIATKAAMDIYRRLPSKYNSNDLDIITDEDELTEWTVNDRILHIELAKWADKFLVAPCTSNTLNKIHYGICDNIVLSTLKAFPTEKRKEIYIAPAMNTKMLEKDIWLINRTDNILFPTVKTLSCGDFGLGALADIEDIVNIINGHKWNSYNPLLLEPHVYEDNIHHPGSFGAKRKHDIHTGVDLYYNNSDLSVYPFEDGKIIGIGDFTGPAADCDWWLPSKYVAVKGQSGIIVYGELEPWNHIDVGLEVSINSYLGEVVQVLKHPPRCRCPGHSMFMLHVELIKSDSELMTSETWSLGEKRHKDLKDPTVYLYNLNR